MDSSKLVEQALRALQSTPDFSNQTQSSASASQMDWSNALAHLVQQQNQQNHQINSNHNQNQNSSVSSSQNQTNSLPSNSNGDSSSSPAPSNTPPENNVVANQVGIKLENHSNNNPIASDSALSTLYNSLLTTPETSNPLSSSLPSFSELSPNIGSASRNKLAKRDPSNLAENERLALVNKRASDRKAAQKYRRKKKLEMDLLVNENTTLKERTKELETQLEQATTAIRMLGEQINNQNNPTAIIQEKDQQITELLARNAELEKQMKGQNVLEELLSHYAKNQTNVQKTE